MAEKSKKTLAFPVRAVRIVLIFAVVIALLSFAFSSNNTYLLNGDDMSPAFAANNVYADGEAHTCELTMRAGSRTIPIACGSGDSVGDALAAAGIELGDGDVLNYLPEDRVWDGMELELTLYPMAQSPEGAAPVPGLADTLPGRAPAALTEVGEALSGAARGMLASGEVRSEYFSKLAESFSVPADAVAGSYYTSDDFVVAPKRTKADLARGSYSPLNDPDAAHEYGSGITVFGEGGNYTGETVWTFDDAGGVITTATGETVRYSYVIDVSATAYTTENTRNRITATGTVARVGAIAVDPTVIPYGTKMYIVSRYGNWIYGYATAEDCGGGIKGHHVDLFYDTTYECFQFGVRNARIYVLN